MRRMRRRNEESMKIDRLLAITIYLLNHGRTSGAKLAQRFEVSARTIARDMDALCLAGIPVASYYGTDGGYEIMDTFQMQRQAAGGGDYHYIVAALEGLASAYKDKELEATLEKMRSLTGGGERGISLDLGAAHENRDTNEMLFLLNRAVQMKRRIVFTYTNSADEVKELEVEPAGVLYKWYNWYLIGYNPSRQDYAMFKVVRMDELRITDRPNEKEHAMAEIRDMLEARSREQEMMEILLYCKKRLKSKCREYLNGRIVEEYENGDFTYQITVPPQEQFWYGVLLSFGKDARVLSPEKLIQRIVELCGGLMELYQPHDS